MKVYEVYQFEEYGDSWPLKIFKSKEKALELVEELDRSQKDEDYIEFYGVREIDADLDD